MSHFLNRQRRPYDWSWLSNHTSLSIIFCYFIFISFHTFVFYVRCRQNYAFFLNPPRKSQEICKLSGNYYKINCKLQPAIPQAVPARTNIARPLIGPPTLERSGSKHRRKALKALNPLLTAFRKSRPKIKAACNDANTTQNNIHSFHNYFFFYLYGVRSWRCRKLSIRSSLNVPSFHILSNSASAI